MWDRGLGAFGPAFSWAALPDAAKWVLSFLMLIGRFGIVCCVVAFLFRILGKMIVLREKIDMYHLINGYSLK